MWETDPVLTKYGYFFLIYCKICPLYADGLETTCFIQSHLKLSLCEVFGWISCRFRSSAAGFLFVSALRSVKVVVFAQIWALSWCLWLQSVAGFLVGHHCRHCHPRFWEIRRFSFQDAGELQRFGAGVSVWLGVLVAFFSVCLRTKRQTSNLLLPPLLSPKLISY